MRTFKSIVCLSMVAAGHAQLLQQIWNNVMNGPDNNYANERQQATIGAQGEQALPQAADPSTGRGTAGRTTGEPGQGDHGQGMKGLGGATVQVLCSPQQIALSQPFTVNVAYTTDVKRPVDIHVDVLNAHTKAFYAGTTIPMDTQTGRVSAHIKMSDQAEEPFLWKVFVAPRGEPFPNMLAESGFVAHLGGNVIDNCQAFKNEGSDPENPPNLDYLMLDSVPKTVAAGSTIPVRVNYSLVSESDATITASLMKKGPNQLAAAGDGVEVTRGKGTEVIHIKVTQDINEPVYVVATMTPKGKGWEQRLAEDRTYQVQMARRLREGNSA